MRGTILRKALELLQEQAMAQADFFAAVLVAGYGASSGRIEYEFQKQQRQRSKDAGLKDRKKRLNIFISKMKHDGLIKKENKKFIISSDGLRKLAKLKNGLPDRHYKINGQNTAIIISFDIPEKLRRKRDWIREVIKNLKFGMIHKSVWVGKTKIPKDFILDLERLKILEYVEIFEISKTGTLKKLTTPSYYD